MGIGLGLLSRLPLGALLSVTALSAVPPQPGVNGPVPRYLPTTLAQAQPKPDAAGTVRGVVSYRQRMALPPNAVIQVVLEDVSLQDVVAPVLSTVTISAPGRQVPIPFVLPYDRGKIKPQHTYAVRARITVEGQLRFINTSRYAVITNGAPTQIEVWVDPVSSPTQPQGQRPATPRPTGPEALKKIMFDWSAIGPDGLMGPDGGKRTMSYEFCIPATPQALNEIRALDSQFQASRSPGRIRCSASQYLVIGSTHSPQWREILLEIAQRPDVQRIDPFWGE
jgi:uncharacterized lipoprotein YbaY